jgi:hypothetical protein
MLADDKNHNTKTMKTKNSTQKSKEPKAVISQKLQTPDGSIQTAGPMANEITYVESNYGGSGVQNDRLGRNDQFREWNQTPLRGADTYYHPDFVIDGC